MARRPVSLAELSRRYPDANLHGFVPTHEVMLWDVHRGQEARRDFVWLKPRLGSYNLAYVPEDPEPRYYRLVNGLWRSFIEHGRVTATSVRFIQDYVPLNERVGTVYAVQGVSGGPIKIGWTQDLDRRLGELQTGNAQPLRVIAACVGRRVDEQELHVRFAHLRLCGEWFKDDPELRKVIEAGGSPIENGT